MNKACHKCKVEKNIDQYYAHASQRDGVDTWCKQCKKDYTNDYRKKNYSQVLRRKKESADRVYALRDWIKDHLPCSNCKSWFLGQVMQFDHKTLVLRKSRNRNLVGQQNTVTGFIEELMKTQLLCANCHALRTAQQRDCKWNLEEAA